MTRSALISYLLMLILKQLIGQQFLTPTADDIDDLRFELRNAFDQSGANRDLLATTVRLIFHDCGGPSDDDQISKCNGCVDFSNPGHAGLQELAIEPLAALYPDWSDLMSRSDFWAAAATIALEYSSELSTSTGTLPEIAYYFGRTTCGSVDGDSEVTKEFVSADGGWDHVSSWFAENLGFSERETVTIIGVHTLGRAHSQYSGYNTLPWVGGGGRDELDNQYYRNLINDRWVQQRNRQSKWQWINGGKLMFDSDISLLFDIDDYLDDDGQVICPQRTGCPDSAVLSITTQFANNNQLWLTEFAAVFDKLIRTGYSDDELTVVTANPFNENRRRPRN